MSQRKFVLSWGRKLFFGVSWPLSMALGLTYVYSAILPQNATETIFYIANYIGHFGLINLLVYFFLYCPLVLIFPNYYFSRIWSLLLVLGLNAIIFFDGLTFAQFQLHLYSFIRKLLLDTGVSYLFPTSGSLMLFSAAVLVIAVLLWLRGEGTWRYMQRRFSNPVKNWYLILIVLCLVLSLSLMRSSPISSSLISVFPLTDHFRSPSQAPSETQVALYPKGELHCEGKKNSNVIMFTIKDWSLEQLNQESMPKIFHLKSHGISYLSHLKTGSHTDSGFFTLMYSLPASFQETLKNRPFALQQEMMKRNYEVVLHHVGTNQTIYDQYSEWLKQRSVDDIKPFFLSLAFESGTTETDKMVHEIIRSLQDKNLLADSYVIIASSGAHHGEKIPLIWFGPERKSGEVSHVTTSYDVLPTLMKKMWSCNNAFKVAGFGESLDQAERKWFLVSDSHGFTIHDLEFPGKITVFDNDISIEGLAKPERIFTALKQMASYRKVKRL